MVFMIQTVNGVVRPDEIRNTLSHEHFIYGRPGYIKDADNCYQRNTAFLKWLKILEKIAHYDVNLIVDATTIEHGRDPVYLQKISNETGCKIVCCTGFFKDDGDLLAVLKAFSYITDLQKYLEELFRKEIEEGIGDTNVKAGAIKVASSMKEIRPLEETIFAAAVNTQKKTGVPILTHCERGTMGFEQTELLLKLGAEPSKVIIGHMTCNRDLQELAKIMDRGFTIALDQFGILSIPGIPTDEEKMENLLSLLKKGYEDRIVISHDCCFEWVGYPAIEVRYPDTIFTRVIPYLQEKGITDATIKKLIRNNLLKILGF